MLLANTFAKRGHRAAFYGACLAAVFSLCLCGVAAQGVSSGSGVVIVYVVGQDGQPVNRTFSVTLSRIGLGYVSIDQMTGMNGVTQFNGLVFSEYRVIASDPDYKDSSEELELSAARSVVALTLVVEPKDNASSDAPAKGFALAPKAKKEVEAGIKAMEAGEYPRALEHLQTAYKLAPGNPDVNDILGEIYLGMKDFPNAQTYIQRAISIEPDDVPALTDMGSLGIDQKDYAGAKVSLERAVSSAPQDWRPYLLLGLAYLHLNQPEKARDEALAAIKVGKGHAVDAEYLLGESLAIMGDHQGAIKALQQLLADAPDNSNAPAAKVLIARLQAADARPNPSESAHPN